MDDTKSSREARRDRLAREHPVRFTLQRVGVAVVEVVLGVLGVGAIIGVFMRGLLPNISWGWLPDVPQWIQDLEPPEWLKYVDPFSTGSDASTSHGRAPTCPGG